MICLMIDDQYAKMPWDKIDTVIFDVGKVLLSFEPRKILEEQFPGQTELHEKLLVKMFNSPYWVMMDHGTVTSQEAEIAMAGLETELRPAIRHILDNWIDLKDVIEEGVEALHACKAHGKQLLVLSNYMSEPFAYACRKHSFFSLFDDMVVSSRVGMVKPDPAIYQYVTERYHLDPARTLFIDDNPANIEAALHHGWQGFCLNKPGKLHDFMAK